MALAELVERGCIEVIVTTFSPRRCDRIARAGIERRSRGGVALLAGTHRIPGLVSLGTSTPMCPRGDLNTHTVAISLDRCGGCVIKAQLISASRGVRAVRSSWR